MEQVNPALLPALTLLVAVMVYAGMRVFQTAYVLFRDGLMQWQGRRVLGELQSEVDSGRRTSFELFLQHGIHHLQLNDAHRARAFFEAAATAHPLSPHGYYGQGLAHRESLYYPARLQEEALLKALERDPRHDDARLLLIEFYAQSGLFDKARLEYNQLQETRKNQRLESMLDSADPPELEAEAAQWTRVSMRERIALITVDLACAGLAVTAIYIPDMILMSAMLLLLLPYHAPLFWRMRLDREGFRFNALRRHLSCRWSELLDLVELPSGGFYLHTADNSIYISRYWGDYSGLLTRVKNQLYARGWVPALKQYNRARWAKPLVS